MPNTKIQSDINQPIHNLKATHQSCAYSFFVAFLWSTLGVQQGLAKASLFAITFAGLRHSLHFVLVPFVPAIQHTEEPYPFSLPMCANLCCQPVIH